MRLLIAALMLCTSSAQAQECRISKNETDEFTGAKVYAVWDHFLGGGLSNEGGNVEFSSHNGELSVMVVYAMMGIDGFVVGSDEHIMFKLANDSVVTLKSKGIYTGERVHNLGVTTSQIMAHYSITPEQVIMLSTSPLVRTRMYFSREYREFTSKPKFGEKFRNAANCICAHLQLK